MNKRFKKLLSLTIALVVLCMPMIVSAEEPISAEELRVISTAELDRNLKDSEFVGQTSTLVEETHEEWIHPEYDEYEVTETSNEEPREQTEDELIKTVKDTYEIQDEYKKTYDVTYEVISQRLVNEAYDEKGTKKVNVSGCYTTEGVTVNDYEDYSIIVGGYDNSCSHLHGKTSVADNYDAKYWNNIIEANKDSMVDVLKDYHSVEWAEYLVNEDSKTSAGGVNTKEWKLNNPENDTCRPIVYYYLGTDDLKIREVAGALIAPNANVTIYGQNSGTVVAKSLSFEWGGECHLNKSGLILTNQFSKEEEVEYTIHHDAEYAPVRHIVVMPETKTEFIKSYIDKYYVEYGIKIIIAPPTEDPHDIPVVDINGDPIPENNTIIVTEETLMQILPVDELPPQTEDATLSVVLDIVCGVIIVGLIIWFTIFVIVLPRSKRK